MEYSILDYSNVIHLRNQIAFLDFKTLLDVYKDKDNYINFLDTFVVLTNIDSGFLLFSDDFVDRIESVIELNRFSFNDKEITEVINGIITYLNELKSKSDTYKKSVRQHYCCFQEQIRGVSFPNNTSLVRSICYDPFVIDALRDNDMSNIGEDKLFLASINSFLELLPELFDDEEIRELTLKKIEEISNNSKLFQLNMKKMIRDTKSHYQKVLKGE